MFSFIGYVERAGSGADTITKGWKENNWPKPQIREIYDPDRVEMVLSLHGLEGNAGKQLKTIRKNPLYWPEQRRPLGNNKIASDHPRHPPNEFGRESAEVCKRISRKRASRQNPCIRTCASLPPLPLLNKSSTQCRSTFSFPLSEEILLTGIPRRNTCID